MNACKCIWFSKARLVKVMALVNVLLRAKPTTWHQTRHYRTHHTLQGPPAVTHCVESQESSSDCSSISWAVQNCIPMVVPLATPEQLPIIDITPLYKDSDPQQKAAVAAAIRNACLNTGFFYVSGPCLPQSDDIFKCMQQLFDLPEGSKAKLDANLSPLHRGYTGLGGAHNCVPDETTVKGPDNKESYLLGAEGSASVMHGPNVWPDPQELPGWRQQVQAYFGAMLELSRAIARGLALSLSLPETFFTDKMQDPVAQLLMLRYPPPPKQQQAAGGAGGQEQYVGCGAHTDCGFLTILAQDDVPGLQVKMASGEWVVAPPIKGTFIVNLGDMTARWTNDIYKSTEHRVFNNSGSKPRYSVPFFCNCDYGAIVAPADITRGEAAKYAPIKAGQYIMQKLGLMWDQESESCTNKHVKSA